MAVTRIVGASSADVTVPVESQSNVVFEYSSDCRRLRVWLLVGYCAVLVDLSRSAALDLVDKLGARAAGMADPEVPAQQGRRRSAAGPAVTR